MEKWGVLKLLFCVSGIYACFLTWAILQEKLTSVEYKEGSGKHQKFKFFIVLNTIQSLIASLVALFYIWINGDGFGVVNTRSIMEFARLSLCSSLASPFGYASLKHINYPTMVLGKSCKLVPVMLINVIFHRKSYPLYKYITVLMITVGVSGFMLSDHESRPAEKSNSLYGLLLLLVNLLLDGATNSFQDQMFFKYNLKSTQMMFFMNMFSFILMSCYLLIPGSELSSAVTFIHTFPAVWNDIILFGLCGALGQTFIFYTLQSFGSLILVTITVTRKLFSILISLLWFDHTINIYQWFFVGVVFCGILLESFYHRKKSKNE